MPFLIISKLSTSIIKSGSTFVSLKHACFLQICLVPEIRNLKDRTNIRLKNQNRSIIGQLNINTIGSKFDFLCSEISPNLDLLLASKRKLDDLFPTVQFLMSGFC